MPRSKTRARIRAARLAAGLGCLDPERTPGRMGHWYRLVWKRFDAYVKRTRPGTAWASRRERNQAVRDAIERWLKAALAEEAGLGPDR